jgi:hypothetical protein
MPGGGDGYLVRRGARFELGEKGCKVHVDDLARENPSCNPRHKNLKEINQLDFAVRVLI